MARWAEFERRSPELAARGWQILYHFGVPLGYLATVRKDGGPRVHPFFHLPDRDDEFYIDGRASHIEAPDLERSVRDAYLATGGGSDGSEMLFECDIEHVMLSTYKKRGEPHNWPPVYTKWHASDR